MTCMPDERKDVSKVNFTNIELSDVIDASVLQDMMNDYFALTGIGVGIIDRNGNVLVGTGWQDICVKFHRAHPESCQFCHASDMLLSSGVTPGTFKAYRCKNNMWDIATPIMFGDNHIGNIFLGQFLYDDEVPDYELFRAQAKRFGYDETAYIAALDRVPRWSHETVDTAMRYYSKLAQMISKSNYSNVVLEQTLTERKLAEEALLTLKSTLQDQNEELQLNEEELRSQHDELLSVEEMLREQIEEYEASQKLLKENESTLHRQINLFSSLLQILPIGVFMVEAPSGKPLVANEAAYNLLGRGILPDATKDNLSNVYNAYKTGTRDPYPPEEMPIVLGMNGVASHVNDMEVERPDGTKTLLEIFGAPVTDDQGRIWASLVSFFDITERKRFEDDLHKSSELFRSLSTELQLILDASPVGICLLKNRKVVRANVAFESMFGYETGTTDTMDTAVLYSSKELYENTGAEAYQLLEGGGSYAKDVLMKKKDGTLFWCTISGHAIKPGNLEEGSIWIIQDISERKQSEERMLILSQRLQLATSSARLGIWDWNVVDNQMVWNDRMFELYGVTPDTFPSNIDAWLNGLHPEDKVSALAECQAALNGDREFNTEFRVLHPDGAVRHLKANAIVMRGADGRAERMTGINADITESRHTEKELIQATAAAESASRIKSQFLANMSHEIRTPMNGIIAISQLLQMTELTEEQREYADLIKSSGNNLVKLLSDILDLSRIEAGSVELEVQDFDLSIELQSTTAVFSLLAKGKGLEFIFDICPDVPLLLSGDIERLRQIITNLVGNAIKFSTEGTVSLHITKDEEDEKFTSLRFLVRDSGIGIARNNVGNIFEAFVQADSSTSIKYGGTGLGLSIARHLVELMGGSIGVESLEGQGSTFWFTAVFQKQADTRGIPAIETAVEAHTTTSAIRILLVEDDPANQFAFNRLLSKSDHQVEIAENGLEALKLLEEKDFDVVLMDCRMPVMDGYEATAAIRAPASRVRNRAIPIIALTANAMREDRDRCIAAGMDDYLSKPIELPVLLAMLGRWVTPQYYS